MALHKLGVLVLIAGVVAGASPGAAGAAEGEPVLFASGGGELTAYRYSTGQTLDVGSGTAMAALSPDGRLLASVGTSPLGPGSGVRVVRPGGAATLIDTEGDIGTTTPPSWSAQSGEFSYNQGDGLGGRELRVADVIESRVIGISSIDPISSSPFNIGSDFAPSGRNLASSDSWGGASPRYVLSIYDLDENTRRSLVVPDSELDRLSAPSWSPDGTEIAYWQGGSLRVVDASTGSIDVLDEGSYIQSSGHLLTRPEWSPDGQKLAYTSGVTSGGERAVDVVRRSGGRSVLYGEGSVWLRALTWAGPDTIAFADDDEVMEVTTAGHSTSLFRAPQRVQSLTFGANTAHEWLPLVASSRSIDAACPADMTDPAAFVDVGPTNVHRRAIDCVAWWEVAQGTSATNYSPGSNVTRAQMATFVARSIMQSGGALPTEPPSIFDDVEAGTHALAINQLAASGIVGGTGEGEYSPNQPVTRAQMATFISNAYRYRVGEDLPTARGDYFLDDQGNTHEDRINRIAEAGIASGTGDRQYSPGVTVRRDQMASFVARLLDILVEEVGAEPPTS